MRAVLNRIDWLE